MDPSIELSIVIPVHNEVDSLAPLHREIDAALSAVESLEIVFVDDASDDGSAACLEELSAKDPRVRVLTFDARHGQSAALAAGFEAARGAITATMDADLQNDPADLPRLLAALDRADCVCGVRLDRRDSWLRRLAARVANGFRNAATGELVTDIGCALRVMRTSHLSRVKMYRGMHRFLPTLLALEGARVIELPVRHRARPYGRSKYGILDRLGVGIVDVFVVRWMKSRALGHRAREGPGDARIR